MTRRALTGVLLATALLLCACGGADTSTDLDPVTIRAAISNGSVEVDDFDAVVARGAEVTVEITSDTATEVHIHGYDRYIRLDGPSTGRTTFTAHLPGAFEVETHDTGLLLFLLQVQ